MMPQMMPLSCRRSASAVRWTCVPPAPMSNTFVHHQSESSARFVVRWKCPLPPCFPPTGPLARKLVSISSPNEGANANKTAF